jgi:hypothetical protein
MGIIERLNPLRKFIERNRQRIRIVEEEPPKELLEAFENVLREDNYKSKIHINNLMGLALPILDEEVGAIPFVTREVALGYQTGDKGNEIDFAFRIIREQYYQKDRTIFHGEHCSSIRIYRNRAALIGKWQPTGIQIARPGCPLRWELDYSFETGKEVGSRRFSIKDIITK